MEDLDSGEILLKAIAYNGTERTPGGMWRISECPGWLLGTLFFADYGYSILALKNFLGHWSKLLSSDGHLAPF